MKPSFLLFLFIFLLACSEDEEPGAESFASCIAPPEGTKNSESINLAVYRKLVNQDGYLSEIDDTFILVNGTWQEMHHWIWTSFAPDADISAFKFKVENVEYEIPSDRFYLMNKKISEFQQVDYVFDVFMNNQNTQIVESDLYLNIWLHSDQCDDVIIR